jgi:hypothetical protein
MNEKLSARVLASILGTSIGDVQQRLEENGYVAHHDDGLRLTDLGRSVGGACVPEAHRLSPGDAIVWPVASIAGLLRQGPHQVGFSFRGHRVETLIQDVLNSPATRTWVKTLLTLALLRDPVESAADAKILADALDRACMAVLTARGTTDESKTDPMDPARSDWLRLAIRMASSRDPVDAVNDAELLSGVLEERCAAIVECQASQPDLSSGPSGQLGLPFDPRSGSADGFA